MKLQHLHLLFGGTIGFAVGALLAYGLLLF